MAQNGATTFLECWEPPRGPFLDRNVVKMFFLGVSKSGCEIFPKKSFLDHFENFSDFADFGKSGFLWMPTPWIFLSNWFLWLPTSKSWDNIISTWISFDCLYLNRFSFAKKCWGKSKKLDFVEKLTKSRFGVIPHPMVFSFKLIPMASEPPNVLHQN